MGFFVSHIFFLFWSLKKWKPNSFENLDWTSEVSHEWTALDEILGASQIPSRWRGVEVCVLKQHHLPSVDAFLHCENNKRELFLCRGDGTLLFPLSNTRHTLARRERKTVLAVGSIQKHTSWCGGVWQDQPPHISSGHKARSTNMSIVRRRRSRAAHFIFVLMLLRLTGGQIAQARSAASSHLCPRCVDSSQVFDALSK